MAKYLVTGSAIATSLLQSGHEVYIIDNLSTGFINNISTAPFPSRKKGVLEVPMKKQVCLIPFRRDFLVEYNAMEPTPLEIIESVDTQEDLEKVATIMKNDFLFMNGY